MKYITRDKAITINGKTWWVNSKGSGLLTHTIKSMIGQVDAMLSYHSKIHLIRFDLRVYGYTENNDIITKFNKRFHRWLERKYKLSRIGFCWCREQENQKHQHYHYVLMVDGHKVRHPHEILPKIKEIWELGLQGSEFTPKNCYYNLKRDDYDSIQKAIWRISYLAKARGKGYKPTQTKNYGTSRVIFNLKTS
ncbi:hypothetical protein tinsulaeT_10640 [Thalassotalea insulae]|uniref:YagK/YfjJ C-terminal domain-containing protein n=1 Tax=Thalassotalea insulae TaxID=2056778 RepID=A0ABQ6GRA6_9GAMM|nr:inovirus-type Gp2 protein [Thalassotalea insulae]GLX77724.1 hypothetical protein tinsulaeT_10640 [Thalassotalea insulae]